MGYHQKTPPAVFGGMLISAVKQAVNIPRFLVLPMVPCSAPAALQCGDVRPGPWLSPSAGSGEVLPILALSSEGWRSWGFDGTVGGTRVWECPLCNPVMGHQPSASWDTSWLYVTSRQLCDGWDMGVTTQTIPALSSFPSSLTSALLCHILCNSQENWFVCLLYPAVLFIKKQQ